MQVNLIPRHLASVSKLKGLPVSPKMSEALLDVPSPSADLVDRSWSLHNSHTQLGPKRSTTTAPCSCQHRQHGGRKTAHRHIVLLHTQPRHLCGPRMTSTYAAQLPRVRRPAAPQLLPDLLLRFVSPSQPTSAQDATQTHISLSSRFRTKSTVCALAPSSALLQANMRGTRCFWMGVSDKTSSSCLQDGSHAVRLFMQVQVVHLPLHNLEHCRCSLHD